VQYLLVFLGGGMGSLLRYGLSQILLRWSGAFPYSTLCANLLACVVLGLLVVGVSRGIVSEQMRLFLAVGFCGGLSTFSTFSNETLQLLQQQRYDIAALYITCTLVICLLAMYGVSLKQ
jgi:CrcB protein